MTAGKSKRSVAALQGAPDRPVRVGISSCLLGQQVRYDGGHKRDQFLTDVLGACVEWVPVCPEMESGFGTPREAMRLERVKDAIRLVTVHTGQDLTDRMTHFAKKRVAQLSVEGLCGYVLKKDSPSCGVYRVKLYGSRGGPPARSGRGLFADALMQAYPNLPIEEEGRLSDARLRENFIERVFAYSRLRSLFESWSAGALVRFHTAHKLTLMAHSPEAYRQLGRLVAGVRDLARRDVRERYSTEFMSALAMMATPRRHVNVLHHITGYFKNILTGASKAELLATIEDYRQGLVPLIVPITLVRHYVRLHEVAYLAGQVYLAPHPKELMLRNHV